MKNKFDWRTEEDQGWEEPSQAAATVANGRRDRFRRYRRSIGTLILLLIAGGLLTARSLAIRVATAEERIRDALLLTHGVLLDAAANHDVELFSSLLVETHPWQQREVDALYDRRAMGAEWLHEIAPQHDVELTRDLQQAVITSTLHYDGYLGGGLGQDVALRHLFFYEREDGQWRLAPHPDEIWGDWITERGETVQAVFSARDAEVGKSVAEDAARTIELLCQGALVCSPKLQLRIRFEASAGLLQEPTLFMASPMREVITLSLPAPTLVGFAGDDDGFRAVRIIYLRMVVRQLFQYLAQRGNDQLQEARLRATLAELDLIPWPGPAQGAATVQVTEDILVLCAEQRGAGSVLLRYDATEKRWVTELSGRNLRQMMALDGAPGVLLREERAMLPLGGAPQVEVVWWGEGRQLAAFEQLHLANVLTGLPAFSAFRDDGQATWIYLGRATDCNGRICDGLVTRAEPTTWSPDGRYALFERPLEGSRSPPTTDGTLWLGDGDGRPIARLEEGFYPFWIDSKTFGYLMATENSLRATSFEYELVLRRVEGEGVSEAQRLTLPIEEALQALQTSAEDEEIAIFINQAISHPSRPELVYLSGIRFTNLLSSRAGPQMAAYIFAVDVRSGEVTVRVGRQDAQNIIASHFSPDGRWLAYVIAWGYEYPETLVVQDLAANADEAIIFEQPFSGANLWLMWPMTTMWFDWSVTGGQLLFLDQGVLTIVEPEQGRIQQLAPPTAACGQAAWAD